jgi:hypothetical protein
MAGEQIPENRKNEDSFLYSWYVDCLFYGGGGTPGIATNIIN